MVASLQGTTYTPTSAYTVEANLAASVSAVLRTPVLYADRNVVHAAFLLADSDGRNMALSTGLTVTMSVSSGLLTSPSCSLNSASGIGDCSVTMPDGYFSTSSSSQMSVDVNVYYSSVLVASASAGSVTLAVSPTHTAVRMTATVRRRAS